MEWYIWAVVVWLGVMLAISLPGYFSFESKRDYLLNINETFGAAASIALIFYVYDHFPIESSKNTTIILTVLVGVSFIVAMLSDFFKSPRDKKEQNKKVGEAAVESIRNARQEGDSYIEAGLKGAMAAEEEKKWNAAETALSLFMLLPNLVAIIIGINTILKMG